MRNAFEYAVKLHEGQKRRERTQVMPGGVTREEHAYLPDGDRLGIRLTESCAMVPDASICGFIFAHPQATYPEIRRISREQYEAYARKRGMDAQTARRFLSHLLD